MGTDARERLRCAHVSSTDVEREHVGPSRRRRNGSSSGRRLDRRRAPSRRPGMTVPVVRRCSTTSRDAKSDATARARAPKLVKMSRGRVRVARARDDVLERGGEWGGAGTTRRLRSPQPQAQPTKTMTAPRDASRDRVKLVSCDELSHVSTLRRANARSSRPFRRPSSSRGSRVDAVFARPLRGIRRRTLRVNLRGEYEIESR